jgi:hypothetical protein
LVGTSLLGAALTWLFHIESTGVNLEEIGAENDLGLRPSLDGSELLTHQ